MKYKNLNTREKILSATIELFGSKSDMTIREICHKAGVNIASINYHFGSKDKLLREVEKHYSMLLYSMQSEIIANPNLDPKDKLINWANGLMEFMFEYPALMTLVANLLLQDESYNPEIINKFFRNIEVKENIQNIIASITNINNVEILNYKYIQLFSGILGPIIFQVLPNVSGINSIFIDLNNYDERIKYIENLVNSILN